MFKSLIIYIKIMVNMKFVELSIGIVTTLEKHLCVQLMQKHLAIACMRFLFVLLKVVSQGFHFNKMHKNVKVICKPQGYGTKEFKDMLIMYKRNLIFQKTCITNNLSRMPLSGTKLSLRLFLSSSLYLTISQSLNLTLSL